MDQPQRGDAPGHRSPDDRLPSPLIGPILVPYLNHFHCPACCTLDFSFTLKSVEAFDVSLKIITLNISAEDSTRILLIVSLFKSFIKQLSPNIFWFPDPEMLE